MNKLRTLIVDDEQASRETLQNYLTKYCDNIEIIGQCKNIIEAEEKIKDLNPDLIFLDIEMPFGNAFDLLEKIDNINFEVIFVTAYDQYALKAINYSASYYILKPIDIEDLEKAVEKVTDKIVSKSSYDNSIQTKVLLEHLSKNETRNKKVVMPLLDGFEVVNVDDIVRCSANDNFTDFYLVDGTTRMICRTLKFYEETLSDVGFMRIHRSHMINLNYLKAYKKGKGGQVELTDGSFVDVSPSRKKDLLSYFSE